MVLLLFFRLFGLLSAGERWWGGCGCGRGAHGVGSGEFRSEESRGEESV